MKQITVIISFLNEGNEVYRTVKSLVDNSDSEFDIILINDGSTDGYDYKQVATEFGAYYVEHEKRKGVTFSRDEGVALCKTKYFLLLDAHMRIYQRNWVELYIKELKKNPESLLCASTIAIDTDGNVLEGHKESACFGTTFRFSDLGLDWITNMAVSEKDDDNAVEIPCVLGASYACSKEYWEFFLGLNGLRYYGFEEQYISMKVWLSGGKCKVLKNIKFGHIFRESVDLPYVSKCKEFIFNQLFITELFFNRYNQWELLKIVREKYGADYINDVLEMLVSSKSDIARMKEYYSSIFSYDINYLFKINDFSIEKYT